MLSAGKSPSLNKDDEYRSSASLAMEGFLEDTANCYHTRYHEPVSSYFVEVPEQRAKVHTVVYVEQVQQVSSTEESRETKHHLKDDDDSISVKMGVFLEEMLQQFKCKENFPQYKVVEVLSTRIDTYIPMKTCRRAVVAACRRG
ncbi:Hypothetical predicted protein [Paramuricea clavata]|uniref:Uncharacterized protein n=1 Tax=Paramuricea clavata TaxID=317549 RepID=A0A7D9HJZ1_PARCT|nr:Hypothetical predicted protein [Paramuricea clavata]